MRNLHFALADGMALPFRTAAFDLVLSHAVIEHVADAPRYLRECARVLTPGGHVYLSTAPYLSFAGAHLPRLRVPVPLHLIAGRRDRVRDVPVARAARAVDAEGAGARELVHPRGTPRRGQGGRPAREGPRRAAAPADRRGRPADRARGAARHGTVRQMPAPVARWLRDSPLTQDVLISNMEYVLRNRRGRARSGLTMADVDRYRPDDKRAVEALYRRVFGHDAAEASRLRWDWQYRRNPNNPRQEPEIWIAREGTTIVGQYATMPVKLHVAGKTSGSWGMDVMVAPERQRQGLGEVLFRTWDRNVGAALGLGLSDSSHRLFQKLRWPDVGPVPCLVKPLTRRALRRPRLARRC